MNANDIAMVLYMYDPIQIGTVKHSLYDEYINEAQSILNGSFTNKEELRLLIIDVFDASFEFVFYSSMITDDLVKHIYDELKKPD